MYQTSSLHFIFVNHSHIHSRRVSQSASSSIQCSRSSFPSRLVLSLISSSLRLTRSRRHLIYHPLLASWFSSVLVVSTPSFVLSFPSTVISHLILAQTHPSSSSPYLASTPRLFVLVCPRSVHAQFHFVFPVNSYLASRPRSDSPVLLVTASIIHSSPLGPRPFS